MRTKLPLIGFVAIAAGLTLYSSTQIWVSMMLIPGAAAFTELGVTGHEVNQSLTPVSIASLAAALALTIAGPVLRRILGVLIALLGAGIGAISVTALVDPEAAGASSLAQMTGLSGGAEFQLVDYTSTSPFILISALSGALLVVVGVLISVLSGRWKSAGRKYEAESGKSHKSESAEPDRISDWEAMNDGFDPSDDEPREDSQGTPSNR